MANGSQTGNLSTICSSVILKFFVNVTRSRITITGKDSRKFLACWGKDLAYRTLPGSRCRAFVWTEYTIANLCAKRLLIWWLPVYWCLSWKYAQWRDQYADFLSSTFSFFPKAHTRIRLAHHIIVNQSFKISDINVMVFSATLWTH